MKPEIMQVFILFTSTVLTRTMADRGVKAFDEYDFKSLCFVHITQTESFGHQKLGIQKLRHI